MGLIFLILRIRRCAGSSGRSAGDRLQDLLASYDGHRTLLGEDHWRTQTACNSLIAFYEATGDAKREAHFRSLLPEEANEDSLISFVALNADPLHCRN